MANKNSTLTWLIGGEAAGWKLKPRPRPELDCHRPWGEVGVGMEKDRKTSGVVKTHSRVDG